MLSRRACCACKHFAAMSVQFATQLQSARPAPQPTAGLRTMRRRSKTALQQCLTREWSRTKVCNSRTPSSPERYASLSPACMHTTYIQSGRQWRSLTALKKKKFSSFFLFTSVCRLHRLLTTLWTIALAPTQSNDPHVHNNALSGFFPKRFFIFKVVVDPYVFVLYVSHNTTTPPRRPQSRSGRSPRSPRTRSPRLRDWFIPTLSAATRMSLEVR
jgi:hypothetical protein